DPPPAWSVETPFPASPPLPCSLLRCPRTATPSLRALLLLRLGRVIGADVVDQDGARLRLGRIGRVLGQIDAVEGERRARDGGDRGAHLAPAVLPVDLPAERQHVG